jgi:hypothetical protein
LLPHFGLTGHAISGYLLATALSGEHRDPIVPNLPVLAAVSSGVDRPDRPDADPPADPNPPDDSPA